MHRNKNNLFTEVLKLKEASDVGNCRNSRGERSISKTLIYVEISDSCTVINNCYRR